jgi:hypothetical protein
VHNTIRKTPTSLPIALIVYTYHITTYDTHHNQHNHTDKLLIVVVVNHITWSTHKITIQNIRTHTCIIGNEFKDQLANHGALLDKPTNTSKIHIAHTTPYWFNKVPTVTHEGAIRNLQTYINKEHKIQELGLAQSKFTYIDKMDVE